MNRQLLATLLMTLLCFPAVAQTTIAVSCECSFKIDSIEQTILVYGERTDATEFDVENCSLVDGKVVPGTCWSAKGPAHMNCLKEARQYDPAPISFPNDAINEEACYGEIKRE